MNFIEDDVIRIDFTKHKIKLYENNCWMINLQKDIEKKMHIEMDAKTFLYMFIMILVK